MIYWLGQNINYQLKEHENLNKADLKEKDKMELGAFRGLLFYSFVFHSNHENILRIFSTDGTGRDIFRCLMNRNRFAVLLNFLWFDDPHDKI